MATLNGRRVHQSVRTPRPSKSNCISANVNLFTYRRYASTGPIRATSKTKKIPQITSISLWGICQTRSTMRSYYKPFPRLVRFLRPELCGI